MLNGIGIGIGGVLGAGGLAAGQACACGHADARGPVGPDGVVRSLVVYHFVVDEGLPLLHGVLAFVNRVIPCSRGWLEDKIKLSCNFIFEDG